MMLVNDLRHAWRNLVKMPVLSTVVVASLGINWLLRDHVIGARQADPVPVEYDPKWP